MARRQLRLRRELSGRRLIGEVFADLAYEVDLELVSPVFLELHPTFANVLVLQEDRDTIPERIS